MRRSYTYLLMTIPAVVLFFAFQTLPSLEGIFYSFTNWRGFGTYHFVGFKNYINLFHDSEVLHAYGFTFQFAIVSTILVNILSLVIAVGLNAKIKLQKTLRAMYFLPNILSVLIVGFIFNYFFSDLVPNVAQNIGMTALTQNILGSPRLAWIGIVIVAVWQATAFNTILYLAGLQTIPPEIYEASSLDGANSWRAFWSMTFPLIAPFFTINMVLAMKNFLMVFDQIVALTGGGPGNATESISFLIYNNGFNGGEFAYQSANAVVYLIVLIAVSMFQIRVLQRREVVL